MAPPDDHAETVVSSSVTIWRVRWTIALAFTLIALVATAHADRKRRGPLIDCTTAPLRTGGVACDPRPTLAAQLASESEAIDKALATVKSKLAEADAVRTRRLHAAYRLIRDERARGDMATTRRRAAAQLLLSRDRAERTLLADEAAHLTAAAARVAEERTKVDAVVLPVAVTRPARGAIARKFGALVHDRSKATLSRRGIDFDVEARTDVIAPGDGVVRYAGAIRGLDEGVVIDHGDYFTVVAKLADLAVPVGARVQRGDRIGRAARQRVYLELRVKLAPGGLPIDPEPLLEDPPKKTR